MKPTVKIGEIVGDSIGAKIPKENRAVSKALPVPGFSF
jgi:hypothetical protein